MIDSDEGKMVLLLLLFFFLIKRMEKITSVVLFNLNRIICVYIYRNCRVGLVDLFIFLRYFFLTLLREKEIFKIL